MGVLAGWNKRKRHVFTAGSGAGTNYQMSITVHYGDGVDSDDDVYCNGLCNTDFSDVRFTSSDGSSVLSYWLQTKVDEDYAVFWVKVTGDLDSDQIVYVYFGNVAAASLSNQANTFVDVIGGVVGAWNMEEALATDPVVDYSGNGNDGTPTGTTIVDGKFVGKKARNYDGLSYITIPHDNLFNVTNLSIFSFVKLTSSAGTKYENIIWLPDTGDPNQSTSYRLGTNWATSAPTITLTTIAAGAGFALDDDTALNLDQWYSVGTTYSSSLNSVKMLVDGNNVYQNDAFFVGALEYDGISDLFLGGNSVNAWNIDGVISNIILFNGVVSETSFGLMSNNYPDVSLVAGSVLVRKYATTTLPTHSIWGSIESFDAPLGGLPGFSNRVAHNIVAGDGAGTNYQMRVHVHYGAGVDSDEDVYCDSRCNVDFSDIRFTSDDAHTLLSYWLESKTDSDNAVFWVKVSGDLDNDQTIYVYYGNPFASSLSNIANTFIDVIGGAVAAYPMNEGSGANLTDYSGNSNTATVTDGTWISNGKFGNAVDLDGVTAYVNIPAAAPLNIATNQTLVTWINLDALPAAGKLVAPFFKTACYGLRVTDGGALYYFIWGGSEEAGVPAVVAGSWAMLTWTYDGATHKFYVNNTLNDSKVVVETFPVLNNVVRLGHNAAPALGDGEFLNGKICNTIVMNAVLTDEERGNLASNYGDSTLVAGSVLVRKWATTTLPTHGAWGSALALPCYCSRTARMRRRNRDKRRN